jgi:hypothetical protein
VSSTYPAGNQSDNSQAQHRDQEAAGKESAIVDHRFEVVKLDSSIDLEISLRQPTKASGVHKHEKSVDLWVQPAWRPGPEEEKATKEECKRKKEDQDPFSCNGSDGKGGPGDEDGWWQSQDHGGPEVVHEPERAPVFCHLGVRDCVVEESHSSQECDQHEEEAKKDPKKFPPYIFPRTERGRPEHLRHLPLLILDDRHPGAHRQEEDEEEAEDRREGLGHGEFGGVPSPLPAYRSFP